MNLDALVGAILAGMLILFLGVVFVSGVILHFMLWVSSGIIAVLTTNNDSLNH